MAKAPTTVEQPAPAVAEPNDQAVAELPRPKRSDLAQLLATDDRIAHCSFDARTPEGRQLLQKCEEDTDDKVRAHIGETFTIKHIYAKVIDYTRDGSDEVIQLLRICLIDTEGRVWGTTADGVRDSLMRLILGHGEPPWKDGVPVIVKQKPTRHERVRLWLMETFPTDKKGGVK